MPCNFPSFFSIHCGYRRFVSLLSAIILKDREGALRASILFCFNPASIFYSSIYTESLYSLLSIGGVYQLVSGANNVGTLLLALSGAARSNGVINAGYTCYQTMHAAYDAVFHRRSLVLTVKVLSSGALHCLCIFIPFIVFQAHGYYNICWGHDPDQISPWCKARLPLLYNYIQRRYWGVGFLRYFQLKQLPNFLLASPILSLALGSIIHYVKLQPEIFLSLGFRGSNEDKNSASMFSPMGADRRAKGSYSLKERTSTIQQGQIHTDLFLCYELYIYENVQIWSGGRNSFLIGQSTSLLVCCPFNGISHKQEEMGILDMGILCGLHPSWQFALLELLPFHLRN
ncbi:hypothetical protein RHMOL_Rhmol13G0302200 [Rhododendron molle]|uniref:Uncharacterized protein n=1 Tax=Rhododendron molle TaxID=49168 RepID=A0ACC0LCL0_RHOML|nr:hypothetical protein RHMOL_Rhmol13G0302200 [Rhododendron molle]